jgi:hypothetical protein
MTTMAGSAFWHQAGLNAVGPLVTAIVGGFIVVLAVYLITTTLQARRSATELKHQLISEMTEAASTLYQYVGAYHRALEARGLLEERSVGAELVPAQNDSELYDLRHRVLNCYPMARVKQEVLEARLRAYFFDDRVPVAWHAVRDCLLVLYNLAVGAPVKRWDLVAVQNAKGYLERYHTSLLMDQLSDWSTVYYAYRRHLGAAANLVLACSLRGRRTFRATRKADRAMKAAKEAGFDYCEPVSGVDAPAVVAPNHGVSAGLPEPAGQSES